MSVGAHPETPAGPRSVDRWTAKRILFAQVAADRHHRILDALAPLGMTSSGLAETPEQVRAACKAGEVDALVVGQVPTDRSLELVQWASHGAERRVVVERAKGILMARHEIDQQHAFEFCATMPRAIPAASSTSPSRWSRATGCCTRAAPNCSARKVPVRVRLCV
jgi:hypothetical protein